MVAISSAMRMLAAWYGLEPRSRLALGRLGLLVLVLISTHNTFQAMMLWLALDWLIEG